MGWRRHLVLGCALANLGCAQLVDLGPERSRGAGGTDPGTGGSGGTGGAAGNDPTSCAEDSAALWVLRFGDESDQIGRAVVPDGQGGVYVMGEFAGALDLGDGEMRSAGDRDLFLARLDEEGRARWSKRFGDHSNQGGYFDIAATPDGVVLAGALHGTVDFGDAPHTADGSDAFAVRFSNTGELLWVRVMAGPGRQDVQAVAFDATSDTTLLAGGHENTMEVDGTILTSAGMADGFLIQLDGAGRYIRSRTFGGTSQDGCTGVAVDADGRIALSGAGNHTVDFGSGPLPMDGDGSGYAALYAPDLTPLWNDLHGGPGGQATRHVALMGSGEIVIAGALWGSTEFCSSSVSSPYGGYLAVLDGPTCIASKAVGELSNVTSLRTSAAGDIWVTAYFENLTDLGSGTIYSAGGMDGIIGKLGSNLSPHWVLRFGSSLDDRAADVALEPDGSAIMIGDFREHIFIEGCPSVTSAGGADLLLAKLRP